MSPDLRAHLRYPEDLFKVQRELLTRYHVSDPGQFFNSQDFWRVPNDPTTGQGAAQPPYYIVAQAPGQKSRSSSSPARSTRCSGTTWPPTSRCPATRTRLRPDAGARVARQPGRARTGPGAGPVRPTTQIAQTVTLLNSQGPGQYGNLLTLPVGGGLLYIEPLYVEAAGEPVPDPPVRAGRLRRPVRSASLTGALDSLFGAGAGRRRGDAAHPSTGAGGDRRRRRRGPRRRGRRRRGPPFQPGEAGAVADSPAGCRRCTSSRTVREPAEAQSGTCDRHRQRAVAVNQARGGVGGGPRTEADAERPAERGFAPVPPAGKVDSRRGVEQLGSSLGS